MKFDSLLGSFSFYTKMLIIIVTQCYASLFFRKKRMSTGTLNFYPLDDDDDFLGPKKSDPVEETVQKKELVRQETAPSIRLQQRLSHKNRAVSALFDPFILVNDNEFVDPFRWS